MHKIDTTVFQHKEELSFFYSHHLPSLETSHILVAGELKNKVIQYVRKEVEPKNVIFKEVYFVKYFNNDKTFMPGYTNKYGKDLLVFMIQVSDFEVQYSIDGEILRLSKGNSVVLLPGSQDCKVLITENSDTRVDVLFFTFLIDNKNKNDII